MFEIYIGGKSFIVMEIIQDFHYSSNSTGDITTLKILNPFSENLLSISHEHSEELSSKSKFLEYMGLTEEYEKWLSIYQKLETYGD
jgi:hypothetical protein